MQLRKRPGASEPIVVDCEPVPTGKCWADTHGVGERATVFGVPGVAGEVLSQLGTLFLLVASPLAAVYT